MNRVLFALALTVLFGSYASAHEGHDHNVMGTVAALHGNHLEVKAAKDGKNVILVLTDKTKVLRDKAIARRDEIKVNERVVVIYAQEKDASGKEYWAAKEVRLAGPSKGPQD